jgi:hypothetical protein
MSETLKVKFTAKPGSTTRKDQEFTGVLDVKFTGSTLIILIYPNKQLYVFDMTTWDSISTEVETPPAIVTL